MAEIAYKMPAQKTRKIRKEFHSFNRKTWRNNGMLVSLNRGRFEWLWMCLAKGFHAYYRQIHVGCNWRCIRRFFQFENDKYLTTLVDHFAKQRWQWWIRSLCKWKKSILRERWMKKWIRPMNEWGSEEITKKTTTSENREQVINGWPAEIRRMQTAKKGFTNWKRLLKE